MLRATQRLAVQAQRLHVLNYQYVPDVLEKRGPFRDGHLGLVKKWKAAGKVKLGGAFDPPSKGAMIVFEAEPSEIEAFVKEDPYVNNGVVTAWEVTPWTEVVEGL